MKRLAVTLIVLVLVAVTLTTGCKKKEPAGQNATEAEPKEIKIGAILPLTGDAAVYGQAMKNGIELGVSKVNLSGGINGRKIRVFYEDDQGIPTVAVNAAWRLISQYKVPAIIGGAMSSTAMSIAPVAEKNEVVLISPAASSPSLSGIGKFFFRVWPSDIFEAREIADIAYKNLNLRKLSIIYVNNDYGKGASEVFKKEFERLGGAILLAEGYELGNTDFRAVLSKVKNNFSEGVYVPGYQKELVHILKQAKELGLKIQFLGGVGFHDQEILRLAGDAAEGTVFAAPYYDPTSSDPATHRFVSEFKAKYGKEPNIFAAHSYDAFMVLVEAVKNVKNASLPIKGAEIRNALLQIKNYPGATGTFSFDRNGDVIKPLRFYVVKGGKFVVFKQQ